MERIDWHCENLIFQIGFQIAIDHRVYSGSGRPNKIYIFANISTSTRLFQLNSFQCKIRFGIDHLAIIAYAVSWLDINIP